MSINIDSLILDLLEWVAREPRTYKDVLDVWRTSCPRLTVWEDSVDRGFVERDYVAGEGVRIRVTALGYGFLHEHGRVAPIAGLVKPQERLRRFASPASQ